MIEWKGTFNPYFAAVYSSPYTPNYAVDPPMQTFLHKSDLQHKATKRIVFSLTTMPETFAYHLKETIDSLILQTFDYDAIYINVPRFNARQGKMYPDPPAWMTSEFYKSKKVVVNRLEYDYGPLTKLVGGLVREKDDPNTIIITLDDDKVYSPRLLQKLVWHLDNDAAEAERTGETIRRAYGSCGWSFLPFPWPWGVRPVYFPWLARGPGLYVDALQAVCGNAYRVGFFTENGMGGLDHLIRTPNPCFTTDDLWIAGNLAFSGVSRVILGGYHIGLDPESPSWKFTSAGDSALSFLNEQPGVDAGCIRAVEERHEGVTWPRAYEQQTGGNVILGKQHDEDSYIHHEKAYYPDEVVEGDANQGIDKVSTIYTRP